jgi:hypothetical protein
MRSRQIRLGIAKNAKGMALTLRLSNTVMRPVSNSMPLASKLNMGLIDLPIELLEHIIEYIIPKRWDRPETWLKTVSMRLSVVSCSLLANMRIATKAQKKS